MLSQDTWHSHPTLMSITHSHVNHSHGVIQISYSHTSTHSHPLSLSTADRPRQEPLPAALHHSKDIDSLLSPSERYAHYKRTYTRTNTHGLQKYTRTLARTLTHNTQHSHTHSPTHSHKVRGVMGHWDYPRKNLRQVNVREIHFPQRLL